MEQIWCGSLPHSPVKVNPIRRMVFWPVVGIKGQLIPRSFTVWRLRRTALLTGEAQDFVNARVLGSYIGEEIRGWAG